LRNPRARGTAVAAWNRVDVAWVRLFWSERCLMSARPGPAVPRCLTGRIRLRGPVRCPVPGGAAAAVTVAM